VSRGRRSTAWGVGALALTSAALAGAAGPARAGVEDVLGLGPEDMAVSGSMVARPGSFASTYYNPAGLAPGGAAVDPPGFGELSVGLVLARPVVYVTSLGGDDIEPDAPVRDTTGLLIGSRFDLGHAFGVKGLNAGLFLYLPDDIFAWSIHPDDRIQWLFLTDRTQRIAIDTALAYRLTSWLSLGVGTRVLFDAETFTTGRVTKVEQTQDPDTGANGFDVDTQLGEEVSVYGRVAPTAGLLVTPHPRLRIGAAYRGKIDVDDWGWTRIQGTPGTGDLGYVHHFSHYYHPHQVALALSGEPIEALTVSFDLTYSRWRDALTTNHEALGPGRYGDTLMPAAGISWRAPPWLEVSGGYRFRRSPFDNFGGPTNLLDNDEHIASLGAEARLGTVGPEDAAVEVTARLAGRVGVLVEREEVKDPRRFASDRQILLNPGYPGYRHGGAVPGASFAVEAKF
jgi:hypothetical protein